jgi:hypothetical protein
MQRGRLARQGSGASWPLSSLAPPRERGHLARCRRSVPLVHLGTLQFLEF